MPRAPPAPKGLDPNQVFVLITGDNKIYVKVLDRRDGRILVHTLNTDKRLDHWMEDTTLRAAHSDEIPHEESHHRGRKRKRDDAHFTRQRDSSPPPVASGSSVTLDHAVHRSPATPKRVNGTHTGPTANTSASDHDDPADDDENDSDMEEHALLNGVRNFDRVFFSEWDLPVWYFSPYSLIENEVSDAVLVSEDTEEETVNPYEAAALVVPETVSPKLKGKKKLPNGKHAHVNGEDHSKRSNNRSGGRTADLIAGGLKRDNVQGERRLWVCNRCFKYMTHSAAYHAHRDVCRLTSPPGTIVYQKTSADDMTTYIYEVDGAEHQEYCQNMCLFAKLFLDVKTIFFEIERFTFYVLAQGKITQGSEQTSHIFSLGFFSKEKHQLDHNLATIVVFPPFQRRQFGKVLIEFSYELSWREGKPCGPERPLSDLGELSYFSFWLTTILRFLRKLIKVPTDRPVDPRNLPFKRRKGEEGDSIFDDLPYDLDEREAELLYRMRKTKKHENDDGSALEHIEIPCSLGDLCAALMLPEEDVLWALRETLALLDYTEPLALEVEDGDGDRETLRVDRHVITREMVNAVWEARQLKEERLLDRAYLQLD
ncbi:acyl-CoA N-acyltransferase [Auriculariales sp. MPI-PUGE-AT-0066]|nr:acyl-CoA N-acyltransferase [Auriculariales sp. MPI-PUGE-AT-0066]